MESFDPFSQWLGRPPGRPPQDHYELLGLPRFEPDGDLIAHTADLLRVKIRKIRPGPHLAQWQRLLDRLEAAKICLSDPIAKAAYDESIDTASHTVNVSDGPVVTWNSPAEEAPSGHQAKHSPEDEQPGGPIESHGVAVPRSIEAPPLVDDGAQADRGEHRSTPSKAPLPAIRPRRAGSRRTGPAVKLLLAIVVLLVIAIGVAILKQRSDANLAAPRPSSPSGETWQIASAPPQASEPSEEPPGEKPTNPKPAGETTGPSSPLPLASPPPPISSSDAPHPAPTAATPPPPPADSQVDPARQQAFRQAIDASREALGSRQLEVAVARLKEAFSQAQTDEDRAEVDQLEVLRAHLEAFWASLEEQIPKLESGSELRVGEMLVVVVEAGPGRVVLRVTGRNRSYAIRKMPHVLAAAMAEQLFSKSGNAKVLRASLLIAEPEGDRDQARQLLGEATQEGAEVDELLAELHRP